MNQKSIKIRIKIEEYIKDNMHTQYDEMPDEWNDTTVVKVVEPQNGPKKLYFNHSQPPPENSEWRNIGKEYNIIIEKKYLYPKKGTHYELFSDSFKLEEVNTK